MTPRQQTSDLRLHLAVVRGTGRDRHLAYVAVDWRSALHDALLGVDCNSGQVAKEFAEYITDPNYHEEGR